MRSTTTGPRCSQSELAAFLNCDRTTVRQMQQSGLPYIDHGRGRAAEYILPLSVNWSIGYRATRKKGVADTLRALSGPLDPLAFALASLSTDGDQIDTKPFAAHLRACGRPVDAARLEKRVGYFEGVIANG